MITKSRFVLQLPIIINLSEDFQNTVSVIDIFIQVEVFWWVNYDRDERPLSWHRCLG
jgi:hypothetical protein